MYSLCEELITKCQKLLTLQAKVDGKELIYKHEPQNLAMMLLMNIRGALW